MPHTFDPFRVLSEPERRAQLRGLDGLFERRDGAMDFPNRRLANREEYFRALESSSPRWRSPFDREGFRRAFDERERAKLEVRAAWLVALARSNESESYGVERDYERFVQRGLSKANPREMTILLEEQYHSRILQEACRTFGLEVEFRRPRWLMRLLIRSMHYLPDAIRYVPILCGEALGTIVFGRLRDTTELFSDDPRVAERLRSLLSEITIDEVFHVVYCRARMASLSLRAARLVAPLVVLALVKDVPQLRDIGLDRREILRRLRAGVEIPAGFEWVFDGTDRLHPAAAEA